jgi:hypothetical protein
VNTSNKLKNIAICEADPDVIYMADDSKIWKTIDGGDNWERIQNPSGAITYLCVKNDDPNTIWYTKGGYNAVRVYKSTDGGENWVDISAGLPSIPVSSIVYNKYEGRSEQLYVGTEVGVYYKDGDADWVAYNSGLPNVRIGELEIYYNAQKPETCCLYAASYGRGLWKSPIFLPDAPDRGNVTGNTQVCVLDKAKIHLTDFVGAIQWEQSTNGTNWSDIPSANTALYISDNIEDNQYLRVKITLGSTVLYSDDIYIEVLPRPEVPTITQNGNTLTSSADEGNQWYNQDGLIPGATEKTFIPTENGTYYTVVTTSTFTCPSLPSNSILINYLSVPENAVIDGNFKLYPNPVNEELKITNEQLKIKRVILVDVLGKEVINARQKNVNEATVNVAKIPAGFYQVKIETDNGTFTSKIVKQ